MLNSRATALLNVRETAPAHGDAVIARALELAGEPSLAERQDDLAAVMARFNARGITSIREAGIDAADNELFRVLRAQGRLTLRCDLLWRVSEGSDVDSALRQIADMPAGGIASPYARLTGVKVFVDGRIADASSLRMTSQDLWAIVEASLRRSGGVGCHAVGDVAVRTVLDVYERALSAGLARPQQLVIEHALQCTPETIHRLAASGVGVSAHPGIVYEFADDIRRHWGQEGAARAAPLRDMVSAGVRVAAGSDGDVPPFDPLQERRARSLHPPRRGAPRGRGAAGRSPARDGRRPGGVLHRSAVVPD